MACFAFETVQFLVVGLWQIREPKWGKYGGGESNICPGFQDSYNPP